MTISNLERHFRALFLLQNRFDCRLVRLWLASISFAQNPQPEGSGPPEPAVAAAPAASKAPAPTPTFNPKGNLPSLSSTEKVNDHCFVNIDRRYPIAMPSFQMRRGAHIFVYVFHPFPFELLTIDPGQAQAFEGTDQASGLINAVQPYAKGATFGVVDAHMESVFTNILLAHDPIKDPVLVGVISGPASLARTTDEKKVLASYKALGPQITYTLNAQSEIANSMLALPSATQKQPVVTITLG